MYFDPWNYTSMSVYILNKDLFCFHLQCVNSNMKEVNKFSQDKLNNTIHLLFFHCVCLLPYLAFVHKQVYKNICICFLTTWGRDRGIPSRGCRLLQPSRGKKKRRKSGTKLRKSTKLSVMQFTNRTKLMSFQGSTPLTQMFWILH